MVGGVTGPTGSAPKTEGLLQRFGKWINPPVTPVSKEEAGSITESSGNYYAWEHSSVYYEHKNLHWVFRGEKKDPGFHIDLDPKRMAIIGKPKLLKLSVLGEISLRMGDTEWINANKLIQLTPPGKYARLEVHVSDGSKKSTFIIAEVNPKDITYIKHKNPNASGVIIPHGAVKLGITNSQTYKDFAFKLKDLGPLTRIEVMLVTDNGECALQIKDIKIE